MKFIFFLLLLLLLNCTNTFNRTERIFICGDHPCVNNKEVEEYFNNNISVEVYTITSNKEKKENFDLVELNLLEDELKKQEKIKVTEKKKNIKKEMQERKKLAKLKMKKVEDVNKNKSISKDNEILKKKENIRKKTPKQFTFIRICKNLEECDISKIEKIVMDIGKQKDFPDIGN